VAELSQDQKVIRKITIVGKFCTDFLDQGQLQKQEAQKSEDLGFSSKTEADQIEDDGATLYAMAAAASALIAVGAYVFLNRQKWQ